MQLDELNDDLVRLRWRSRFGFAALCRFLSSLLRCFLRTNYPAATPTGRDTDTRPITGRSQMVDQFLEDFARVMFGYSDLIEITAVTKAANQIHQRQTAFERQAAMRL